MDREEQFMIDPADEALAEVERMLGLPKRKTHHLGESPPLWAGWHDLEGKEDGEKRVAATLKPSIRNKIE
jgi:hypothetical protein